MAHALTAPEAVAVVALAVVNGAMQKLDMARVKVAIECLHEVAIYEVLPSIPTVSVKF